MGNIVFGGCSYTWGQSLWYHGNFEKDIHPIDGMFYSNKICDECMEYMIKNRFATQVANHFNREPKVRATNGGSNTEIIEFCKNAVDSNTELIIIQTTHFTRSPNTINEQIKSFENFVYEMESKNIPVRFIHWMYLDINNEEYELIKKDSLYQKYLEENQLHSEIIRNRTILLDGDFNFWKWTELGAAMGYYNRKKYPEIEKRTIVGYFGIQKEAKYRDTHFSLYGHDVVGKSIIEYIEKNILLK
jgi:hypothetical protein